MFCIVTHKSHDRNSFVVVVVFTQFDGARQRQQTSRMNRLRKSKIPNVFLLLLVSIPLLFLFRFVFVEFYFGVYVIVDKTVRIIVVVVVVVVRCGFVAVSRLLLLYAAVKIVRPKAHTVYIFTFDVSSI